jgi:hypothetical protein
MHFVKDSSVGPESPPGIVQPFERPGLDHLRGPVRALRLKSGGRIRQKFVGLIESKAIENSGVGLRRNGRKIAVSFGFHL